MATNVIVAKELGVRTAKNMSTNAIPTLVFTETASTETTPSDAFVILDTRD